MLDGTLEGLGEVIAISEDVQQMENATAIESVKMEAYEKFAVSEVDEIRVNETAEIMAEVFSDDVLASWAEMSLDEKSALLNEYYVKAGANLGIETRGVILEPMPSGTPGMVSFGYNSGDGYIHLNSEVVNDPAQLGQVLETATHEMRHQFQSDVLSSPGQFMDISSNVLSVWEYENDPRNYISPDYDYEGYYNQAIERDARSFSEDVLRTYMNRMNLC